MDLGSGAVAIPRGQEYLHFWCFVLFLVLLFLVVLCIGCFGVVGISGVFGIDSCCGTSVEVIPRVQIFFVFGIFVCLFTVGA